MRLEQTVGIIMGANIGTTVTAQLLRLGDLSSDNLLFAILNPSVLGPLLAAVGVVFYMFIRGGKKRIVGQIALGLGLLFIGMKTMEGAVSGLRDLPEFQALFSAFSNPLLGILAGAAVTALLQSSSASMGILQAVSSTGLVYFHTAIPIILGQNIGTCITAILSAIGASRNAKRTAMVHLLFNVIGTAFFLTVLYLGNSLFAFPFWDAVMDMGSNANLHLGFNVALSLKHISEPTRRMDMGSIANLHLGFNVACTLLLLPFHKLLVKIVERLVPGDAAAPEFNLLDERFLASPSVALEQARAAVISMGEKAREDLGLAVELLAGYDEKKLERLHENEATIDKLENTLDNYLVKLTDRALTDPESAMVSELLHTLTNFERIGDYAVNISEIAATLHQREISFSEVAKREVDALTRAVEDTLDMTLACYEKRDHDLALHVEPMEEVVDLMEEVLKHRHVERLKAGTCTIELGTQFLELTINLERISDHCSNVAMLIVRQTMPAGQRLPDTHAYLKYLHAGGDQTFDQLFARYRAEYFAPIAHDPI